MTRSNRPLTQFAVDHLKEVLKAPFGLRQLSVAGNTETEFIPAEMYRARFSVSLFGEEIFLIWFSSRVTAESIILRTGDFYDSKGRPSRTTRERLNGLLDALGGAGLIPEGVRAFIDPETGQSRIGKGNDYRVFDATNDALALIPDTDRLRFVR